MPACRRRSGAGAREAWRKGNEALSHALIYFYIISILYYIEDKVLFLFLFRGVTPKRHLTGAGFPGNHTCEFAIVSGYGIWGRELFMKQTSIYSRGVLGLGAFALMVAAAVGVTSLRAPADDVDAVVGERNGNLDVLDITTGEHTVIANDGSQGYNGLAYNSDESVLYGIIANDVFQNSQLVTVNKTTGVDTVVGGNGVPVTAVTNLANGTLYGVDDSDNLYEISATRAQRRSWGRPAFRHSSMGTFDNSLASDGTNLYYTLSIGNSESILYSLNTTTGAATEIGATGLTGILGSAFAGETFGSGKLYAFDTNGETSVIDLSSGLATVLNSNGLNDIAGGVGIVVEAQESVPEPSVISMLALGGVILAGWKFARRRIASCLALSAASAKVRAADGPEGTTEISRWRKPPEPASKTSEPRMGRLKILEVTALSIAPPGLCRICGPYRWLTPPANIRRPSGPRLATFAEVSFRAWRAFVGIPKALPWANLFRPFGVEDAGVYGRAGARPSKERERLLGAWIGDDAVEEFRAA